MDGLIFERGAFLNKNCWRAADPLGPMPITCNHVCDNAHMNMFEMSILISVSLFPLLPPGG